MLGDLLQPAEQSLNYSDAETFKPELLTGRNREPAKHSHVQEALTQSGLRPKMCYSRKGSCRLLIHVGKSSEQWGDTLLVNTYPETVSSARSHWACREG